MKYLRLLGRGGKLVFFTTACWLVVHGTVLAQVPPKKEETGGGSYVLPYMLVLLGIGLGMLCVCRSSGRRDRAKPEQYEEAKATKE
jgi:SNF family Na+-dependent transporter